MRNVENVFHLSIPCRNLEEAREYYVERLGCKLARRYDDRITLDFFGDQVVCHLAPEQIDLKAAPYPKHFGITFRKRADFDSVLTRLKYQGLELLVELNNRFEGRREEHMTFMIADPSNNVIEFKCYQDHAMMY